MIQNKIIFLIIIQFISLFGTHMSNFALGLYLYEKSGSLDFYSYFLLFLILPEMLFSPIIGFYIDKYNKKAMMILGHLGAGVVSIIILITFKYSYESLSIYLTLIIISSLFSALVFASFHVQIGNEIEIKDMNKTASLIQLGFGLVMIISPAISAYLLEHQSLETIFYIDIITFIIAIFIISLINFSKSYISKKHKNIFFKESIRENYIYLKKNKILSLSLILFAFIEFCMAQVTILITPIILSISTKSTLGVIMSIGGTGMILGSILWFFIKIKNHIYWFINFTILQSFIFFMMLFQVGITEITIGTFLFMFFSSLIGILNYTYWQEYVEQEIKGSLFGLRRSIILFSITLGYLASVPMRHMSQILIENFPFILKLIGTYLYPEIRLLFIINACLILLISILIIKYNQDNGKFWGLKT